MTHASASGPYLHVPVSKVWGLCSSGELFAFFFVFFCFFCMQRKMNVCRVLYPSIFPFSPRSQIRRNRANCGVFAGLGCESEKRQVLELQCRTGRRDRITILKTLHCTSRTWGEWHTQARLERCTTQSIPVLSL